MVASGILLVDKPEGMTSHDVVARARRALGTRKIGHAGTLDPMATGLLVLGVEAATRLLTYIVGADKTYRTTIRLGASSSTDDAEGQIGERASAAALADVTPARLAGAVASLTGTISQVPATVSAIKVGGRRAYDLARSGEDVALTAREVTVSRFEVGTLRLRDGFVDVEAGIDCSSGTYIRALARDLGAELSVGGHLTALRRTRVGPFEVSDASALDALGAADLLDPATAITRILPAWVATAEAARDLRHGKRVDDAGWHGPLPAAALAPDGSLVGIVERRGSELASLMNMPEVQA